MKSVDKNDFAEKDVLSPPIIDNAQPSVNEGAASNQESGRRERLPSLRTDDSDVNIALPVQLPVNLAAAEKPHSSPSMHVAILGIFSEDFLIRLSSERQQAFCYLDASSMPLTRFHLQDPAMRRAKSFS